LEFSHFTTTFGRSTKYRATISLSAEIASSLCRGRSLHVHHTDQWMTEQGSG
jgi:hypothetical protein